MSSRRPGSIYVIRTRRPNAGWRVTGYVGQTRQRVEDRIEQHRKSQPWGDTIVGYYVIFSSKRISDAMLTIVEWFFILVLLPLYNDQHNRANPRRISAHQAKAGASRRGRLLKPTALRTAPARRSVDSPGSGAFAAVTLAILVLVGWDYFLVVAEFLAHTHLWFLEK